MNREQLQAVIADLEYLVVNHPDKARVEGFRRDLEEYSEQLRALDAAPGASPPRQPLKRGA